MPVTSETVKLRLRLLMRASLGKDEEAFDDLLAAYTYIEYLETIIQRMRAERKSALATTRRHHHETPAAQPPANRK